MAATMEGRIFAPRICKILANSNNLTYKYLLHVRQMGFINKLKFFRRKNESEKEEAIVSVEGNEKLPEEQLRQFRKRMSIEEKCSYKPPADAYRIIHAITYDVFSLRDSTPEEDSDRVGLSKVDWLDIRLDNRVQKFNLLTHVMEELNHDVSSIDLNDMKTVADVVKYFNIEVKDTSVLEDLSKLDLPKNLHMNLEYVRFHPDTDKIYDGVTAYPGQATKVTSLKYRRKYKGYDGGDPINYPENIIGNA